jgi:hypothetical protein
VLSALSRSFIPLVPISAVPAMRRRLPMRVIATL